MLGFDRGLRLRAGLRVRPGRRPRIALGRRQFAGPGDELRALRMRRGDPFPDPGLTFEAEASVCLEVMAVWTKTHQIVEFGGPVVGVVHLAVVYLESEPF